jgi:prepilin-type N-terminal cleavage/methylation domain-containing protein
MAKYEKGKDELNKGFTIVELIIVIAIMSIVGLILGTLITTGVNLYQRQNKDLNLQTRSQLLQSQITTYITNADLGLYAPENGDAAFFPSKDVSTIFAMLTVNKEYYSSQGTADINKDIEAGTIHAKASVIAFNKESGTVYYFTGFNGAADGLPVTAVFESGVITSVTPDGSGIASEDITKWPVLSDYVSEFKIGYKGGDESVNVQMALEYSERTYNYDFTIALRNDTSLYGAGKNSDGASN